MLDEGRELAFTFDEMVRYNGGRSPGGVALAYKALERGLLLLDAGALVERRQVAVASASAGPGVRDAFELVTRAVSDDRYRLDLSLARPENGPGRSSFVFKLERFRRVVTIALRDGFVSGEFVEMLALDEHSAAQQRRFAELKAELAERVMAGDAEAVYDAWVD